MNTTDQAFIRAYGSDFVPSYADEAARAADYPALADSNVNAVFGSLPQRHFRVDGPTAAPSPAEPRPVGNAPTPLPPRPYVPQPPAQVQAPPIQEVPVEHVIEQHEPTRSVARPEASTERVIADEPQIAASIAPVTPPGHVPRPHLDFAAARRELPATPEIEAADEQVEEPQPARVPNAKLSNQDGFTVLADSSVLIGSSGFEWPTLEPTTAHITVVETASEPPVEAAPQVAPAVVAPMVIAPAVQVSLPEVQAVEPVAAPTESPTAVEDAVAPTRAENAGEDTAEKTAENTGEDGAEDATRLSPAIANVAKEPAGAEMAADDTEEIARPKLKPAWEVDRLLWPNDADQLYESESEYFRHAGEKLRDASQEGLRVLGIAATNTGEGCTTLAICLARAAAAAGAKVALLDANLRTPQLGTALGLDFARSWHETLDGETPLAEAAVTAIADNVTLIPLSTNAARQGLKLDTDKVNDVLRHTGESFDLVLVDVGVSGEESGRCFQAGDACPLDAAIIVRDVRATSEEETLDSVAQFKALGVDAVGIAENFAASTASQAAA